MIFAALVLAATAPTALSDECAIVGEVAREVHRFEERVSPPLREGAGYLPHCPWEAMGLRITPPELERGRRWVHFWKPRIDGNRATVRTGIMHGRLAGQGSECRLLKTAGEWRLETCRRVWAS